MKKHIKSAIVNNLSRSRYTVPSQIAVIYFLQGEVTGMIKISHCRNLQANIQASKQFCSEELTLLGKVNGSLADCNELHQQFAHLRAHDDWFHSDVELLEFAKSFSER